jgi:predicted DsbA family dithiol-disulfide isomerase
MPRLSINIVSDTICPWCFVGKRRLEKALTQLPAGVSIGEIRWHPFYLDATLPKEGKDKMSHYNSKFGAARVEQMLPMMHKVGGQEGISFDYGGKIANTRLSHALLEASYVQGGQALQGSVVEALFKFYFERQGNLGDVAALRAVCASAGFSGEALEAALTSQALAVEVDKEEGELRKKYNITGVPFFIISSLDKPTQRPVVISGAEEASTFLEAFEQVGV